MPKANTPRCGSRCPFTDATCDLLPHETGDHWGGSENVLLERWSNTLIRVAAVFRNELDKTLRMAAWTRGWWDQRTEMRTALVNCAREIVLRQKWTDGLIAGFDGAKKNEWSEWYELGAALRREYAGETNAPVTR